MSPRPVRRTQAIIPFGIGAMIDFPGPISLIHCGIDAWPFRENDPNHREFKIEDEKRLAARLGVKYFVQPPDYRYSQRGDDASQPNLNIKLPFLRFPKWHVCPRCGRMFESALHDKASPVCEGPLATGKDKGKKHRKRKTVQVRFVAACPKGHLQDFPWWEWLFQSAEPNCRGRLRMHSSGSSSLAGIRICCEEESDVIREIQARTLRGAFDSELGQPSALSKLNIFCRGDNPALGIPSATMQSAGCGSHLYPLLKGGSNVYFPHIVSSIYIPDVEDLSTSQEILDVLDDYTIRENLIDKAFEAPDGLVSPKMAENTLRKYRPESRIDPIELSKAANNHIPLEQIKVPRIWVYLSQSAKISTEKTISRKMIEDVLSKEYPNWAIDPEILVKAANIHLKKRSDEYVEGSANTTVETELRTDEYNIFCRDIQEGYPRTNLLIRSENISNYDSSIVKWFERIALVHKLRETRAFMGYSRIFPENDLSERERKALISRTPKEWLPAIIVRGEGIFLQLREAQINQWIKQYGEELLNRICTMRNTFDQVRTSRNQELKIITPRYVMIHTLSHLLMNQLIYDCGYGSASLRERLYSADGERPMAGILIYTAAGDSEGTMGGLVRMGKPGRLEEILVRALEKARWCSSDPVCIESYGQGPDNCNLAACHSCTLLPETSCEEQNRLLDRGLAIGTITKPHIGFFNLR